MDTESEDAAGETEEEGVLFDAPPLEEQVRMCEAILFASADPVTVAELEERMPHGCEPDKALEELRGQYEGRGVHLVKVGPAWAFRTAPGMGFLMRKETVEERKMSRAAIETLAIVAYHQPVTRAEIEEIRGVAVSRGTIDRLLELEWIRLGRRRMTPGRPVTFVVTQGFLDHFGLESARDLPGLKELRASGLLESRAAAEEAEGDVEETGEEQEEFLLDDPDDGAAPAGDGSADGAEPPDGDAALEDGNEPPEDGDEPPEDGDEPPVSPSS